MAKSETFTSSTVIATEPAKIFDLLANPNRHSEWDGSSMVNEAIDAPGRLSKGESFKVRMRKGPLRYVQRSKVVVFEENRAIAWQPVGGQVWRYDLAPEDGCTRVTETFTGPAGAVGTAMSKLKFTSGHQKAIEDSLARLKALVEKA